MTATITFSAKTAPPAAVSANVNTLLWHTGTLGVIMPPSEHTSGTYPQGPYDCEPVMLPLNVYSDFPLDTPDTGLTNAWYPNGGSFYKITSGPYTNKYVYAWTNGRTYGNISIGSVSENFSPPTEAHSLATINPLAAWRILIKGMVGGGDVAAGLTINAPTLLWHTGRTGVIMPPSGAMAAAGGPYTYESVMLPLNFYSDFPDDFPLTGTHGWYPNGGSFYKLTSGPYSGQYIYRWSNGRGYGNVTAVASGSGTASEARGPGATLATIYRPAAHLAGASINYNAPGELHFTLLVDDPNVRVPIPKKTHYAVEFETSPGSGTWVEVFAGLIWDIDATDTEVVFYGIDYLGLLGKIIDQRYQANIDKPVERGGSKYVKKTIKWIIREQLYYAINLENSPVGFIKYGSIPDALEKYRIWGIYSTFRNSLQFILELINSYRAGSGKYTRLEVVKVLDDGRWPNGCYKFRVVDDPGEGRPELGLVYGSLAQGYRIVPFGNDWGTRVHLIGRNKDGKKVTYASQHGATLESEFGRYSQPAVVVETEDAADLTRRALQAATDAAALGRQIGVGIKLGAYRPLEGYDICDWVPVDIDHGGVDTQKWGSDPFGGELVDGSGISISSGMWVIVGLAWETYDDGHWITNAALFPKNHVPYEPALDEPDYGGLSGRGGVGCYAMEITGVDCTPVFEAHAALVDDGAVSSATLPVSPALDTTRGFFAIVGLHSRGGDHGVTPPSGWTEDYDDACGNGDNLFAMHRIYDPDTDPLPATITPIMTFNVGTRSCWAGFSTGFYVSEPGVAPTIRQVFQANTSLPGDGVGGTRGPFAWDLAPLSGSILIAFVGTAAYFGANGPIRGRVESPGHLPMENLYTHIGWTALWTGGANEVGWGRLVDHHEWEGILEPVSQGGTGFMCEYRMPYSVEGEERPPTSSGVGPPNADTPPSDLYTDQSTGIQWRYDWAAGVWIEVPGTGNVASGLFDFNFTAATTWVIIHTLGNHPRVTLSDSTGAVIEAAIVYDSTTQITVYFSSAVAGSAHLG